MALFLSRVLLFKFIKTSIDFRKIFGIWILCNPCSICLSSWLVFLVTVVNSYLEMLVSWGIWVLNCVQSILHYNPLFVASLFLLDSFDLLVFCNFTEINMWIKLFLIISLWSLIWCTFLGNMLGFFPWNVVCKCTVRPCLGLLFSGDGEWSDA